MRLNKQIMLGVFFLVGILLVSSFILPVPYSSSSPQFAPPGVGSFDYLNRQGFDLAPTFGESSCDAGQDFVIQIPPFGCTPAVVRSDLLEEQNVPVFCQLSAIKINPLIEVEAIDSLTFKGDYPDSIQGIGFHPARAAVKNSQRTLLNSPILQNIGYAVIVLKQQKDESSMPDSIKGDLTANIRYNIKNAFGIGRATQYLPEFSEDEWSQNFKKYSFWDGRAFLRADSVGREGAIVSLYSDENNKISTANLGIGKTSNNIFLPGFSCLAGLKLRLDGVEDPDTMAKLDINGEIVQVIKREKFLDNYCRAISIDKRGLVQETEIVCNGGDKFKLMISPSVKLEIASSSGVIEKDVAVGEKIYEISEAGKSVYLGYIGEREGGKFIIPVVSPAKTSEEFKKTTIYKRLPTLVTATRYSTGNVFLNSFIGFFKVSFGTILSGTNFLTTGSYPVGWINEESIGGESWEISKFDSPSLLRPWESLWNLGLDKLEQETWFKILLTTDVKFKGFSTPVNHKFKTKEFKTNFDNAMKDYRTVISNFPNEKQRSDDPKTFGQKALTEAIKFSFEAQQMRTAFDLCIEFEERYPNDEDDVEKFCGRNDKFSNTGVSQHSVFVNGKIKAISFEGIYEPTIDEFGAVVTVKNIKENTQESVTLGKNQIYYINETAGEFIQLKKLDTDSASLNVNLIPSSGTARTLGQKFLVGFRTIKKNTPESLSSNYVFTLTDVNLKKVAKVSVIPNIKNAGTEANFSFNIGIEKRSLQLSPDQTKDRIDALDESIDKWGGRSEKLGKVVRGFNAACLAVGTTLTIKNLIDDFDGRAIARQEVMRSDDGWYDVCKKLVNEGNYPSVDSCLLDKSPEIDRDVELVEEIIKNQGAITNDNIGDKLEGIREGLGNKADADVTAALSKAGFDEGKVTLTEARDIERLTQILNSNPSPELRTLTEAKLNRILSNMKVNAENFALHTSLQKQLNDGGFGNVKVRSYGNKDSIKGVYDGGVMLGSKISGAEGLKPNEEYSTQVITLNNVAYLLILDGSGTDYFIGDNGKHTYRLNGVSDGQMSVSSASLNENREIRTTFSSFKRIDTTTYNNEFKNPEVKYFETEPYKGLPAIVPFNLKQGWYAATKQILPGAGALRDSSIRAYQDSGQINSFYLCNVGPNGKEQFNSLSTRDDECMGFNPAGFSTAQTFPGLTSSQTIKKVKEAQKAIQQASQQHSSGVKRVQILNQNVDVGNPEIGTPDIQCQDFMSPEDCNLLFNVCDPVVCPSSRCDFGGSFPVSDVVQSGIIGSTLLCLPNYQEDIYVPMCLTGIKAGVDSFVSVQQNYRDCLQTNLETGETVGICDEIHSVYLCDFFWSQTLPLSQVLVPKALEYVTGQTGRGGGEYLGVATAWKNAGDSVDYMTNYYGANSFEAFKTGVIKELGNKVCENFISVSYPDVDFMDSILEPESPPQYTAWFDERTFSTATVPPTSQYKVFYHIFAGKNEGAYYSVYLKNPSGTSFFATNPTVNIANGYIPAGDYASETKDFTGVAGYRELCINVNGQEECGFNQVSTNFGLDYLQDQYVKEQAGKTDIQTENECVSGTPSLYSLANPNLQAGIEGAVNPTLYNTQLVRVCSTSNPGQGTDPRAGAEGGRWIEVGTCDKGIGNLKCYLDKNSVKDSIEFQSIANETLQDIEGDVFAKIRAEGNFIKMGEELTKIEKLDATGKINYINQGLLDRAFYSKEKAHLIFIRGTAYAKLALNAVKSELEDLAVKKFIRGIASLGGSDSDEFYLDICEEKPEFCDDGDATDGSGGTPNVLQPGEGDVGGAIGESEESPVVTWEKEEADEKWNSGKYLIFEFKDGSIDTNLYYRYDGNVWKWSSDKFSPTDNIFSGLTGDVKWVSVDLDPLIWGSSLSQRNQNFIKILRNKNYGEGIVLLAERTKANNEGGYFANTGLFTEKINLNHKGIFIINQLEIQLESIYIEEENGKWYWTWSLMEDDWISVEDTTNSKLVAVSYKNKELLKSLKGQNFDEGVVTIFNSNIEIKKTLTPPVTSTPTGTIKGDSAETVEITSGTIPDSEEVKLDSAILELGSLIEKYGLIEYTKNVEYVTFVDKIYVQSIITDEEYNKIKTRTSFGSNIAFVRDLLESKRESLVGRTLELDKCLKDANWVDKRFNVIDSEIKPGTIFIELRLKSEIDDCKGYTIAVYDSPDVLSVAREFDFTSVRNLKGRYFLPLEVNEIKEKKFFGLFNVAKPTDYKFRIQDSERNEIFEGKTITVSVDAEFEDDAIGMS